MKSNSVNRREFLKTIGISSLAMAYPGLNCGIRPGSNPNIIYILADDLGYGDIGCLNPECKIPTPNIDRLAGKGVRFTDAHSGSAVCTPTRYGILTGRYSWRTRLQSGVLWGYSTPLIDKDRMTAASLLKQQGYSTACIGKWHLGWNWALRDGVKLEEGKSIKHDQIDFTGPVTHGPTDLGFDYFFGIPASLDMVPYVYLENDRVVEPPTASTEGKKGYEFYRAGPIAPNFEIEQVLPVFTQKTVDYINNHSKSGKRNPFFIYLPLSAPHTPILPTDDFKGKSGVGPYGDFVCQCDWTVGQIVKALEKNGISDNTLIIFTSDNGCSPMANFKHLESLGHYPSFIFRGHKADIFEGGHRIPFIASWPGRIKARTECDEPVCLTDFMATAADITVTKLPDNAGEDSVSLLPGLLGEKIPQNREAIVHHSINGFFAIRKGKWKLELCPGSGGWSFPQTGKAIKAGLPMVQLYDLSSDISEKNNLQDKYPEVVKELTELLEQYVESGRSTPGIRQKNDVAVDIRKPLKIRDKQKK